MSKVNKPKAELIIKKLNQPPLDSTDKAFLAAANEKGMSYDQLSECFGYSKGVISKYLSKHKEDLYNDHGDQITEIKKKVQSKYEILREYIMESISEEDIAACNGPQKIVMMGILHDKIFAPTLLGSEPVIVLKNNIKAQQTRIDRRNLEMDRLRELKKEQEEVTED